MAQPPSDSKIRPLFYKLPAEKIVIFKCLLESYELLGELRTLDADAALVVVLALESTASLTREVLASEPQLKDAREIEPPSAREMEQFSGDWLISELYDTDK